MSENGDRRDLQKLPSSVYLVGSLSLFAQGMYSPIMSTYLVDMGANNFELGVFRSIGNVSPTLLQPGWGAIADKMGRNKPFVAFGTFTGLAMVFLFLYAATPLDMIILFAIQSILLSIQIPTWQSLVGSLMDEENRGDELGKLGIFTNIASFFATLLSGFIAVTPVLIPIFRNLLGPLGPILIPVVSLEKEQYVIPFFLTATIGIIASLLSLIIHEKRSEESLVRKMPPVFRLLSQPGDFRRFCFSATIFSFGMSMAWPYFVRVQRDWLSQDLFVISVSWALLTGVLVLLTIPFGRLSDRVGRKPLILFGRGILFTVPLLYAFATNDYFIFVSNAIAGIATAASVNAITAYIYDVAPEDERGAYLGVFNTYVGVVFFFGSLLSGILGELLVPIVGDYMAVFYMLIISCILRFIGSFFFIFIKEPREYSSTVRMEILGFIGRKQKSEVR
jgi:MFS family permease